ncbi:MAG: MFS family permease [Verrucomicrobiales bacterium]
MNGLFIILFELPITSVTQRFPIRRVMALGFVLLGFGLAMNGLVSSLPLLALAMGILTLGEMIAFPLMGAFVAKMAPPDMRGRYMGANGCVWSISLIFGPALGLSLYGGHPTIYWWGCLMIGVAAALVILVEPRRG